ncbi:hypothetical protein WJX73_004929 [Symbiochloris irregularis]|uniref:HTH myb-type domain-containing protein n=1 Tax=Symbiochloris irregularis TaxID=706552 RepID=A0AAW1NPL7_9CHLO
MQPRSQSLLHSSLWEGGTASADTLVPLNTQIISPTLAETFLIPFLALDEAAAPEQPPARQLVEYAIPRAPNSRGEPQGFVRYQAYPEDANHLYRQPSTSSFLPEASLGGRGQGNGFTRTPFADRLPAPTAQHPPSARDSGQPGRHPAGAFSGGAAGHLMGQLARQDGAAGPGSKRTSQHTDPQRSQSAAVGSLDTGEENFARALKRPRLVWTTQLHARFVDAVNQLGLKNAVPKTIMQLMGVEGLTRENVASHLQKYRLQLRKDGKDVDGNDDEDDHQNAANFLADAVAARRAEDDSGGAQLTAPEEEGDNPTDIQSHDGPAPRGGDLSSRMHQLQSAQQTLEATAMPNPAALGKQGSDVAALVGPDHMAGSMRDRSEGE